MTLKSAVPLHRRKEIEPFKLTAIKAVYLSNNCSVVPAKQALVKEQSKFRLITCYLLFLQELESQFIRNVHGTLQRLQQKTGSDSNKSMISEE